MAWSLPPSGFIGQGGPQPHCPQEVALNVHSWPMGECAKVFLGNQADHCCTPGCSVPCLPAGSLDGHQGAVHVLSPGTVPGAVSALGFSDSKWDKGWMDGWTGPTQSPVNQPNQTKERKETRDPRDDTDR